MADKQIAAIVVTYNRCFLLQQCLEALLGQTVKCDILVVDNHSTDETQQIVSSMWNLRILYRKTAKNLGGAGGFNFGTRWAIECGYDYLWLMDDDTLPQPNSLEELLNADNFLSGRYGFLSSGVLWTDGTDCQMNRQRAKERYYSGIWLLQNGIAEVDQATFVSFFCNCEVVKKVGLPIKEFFIWGDDIEFSHRISSQMGYPCYLVSRSIVIHRMENNIGSRLSTDRPARIARYEYAYRNENYINRKKGVKSYFRWLLQCAAQFGEILFHSDHKFARWKALVRGIFKGFFFHPKIEYCEGASKQE